ncbi:MAG: hypothetical protein K0B02_00925 [DPANN group archaeon]|nr:hypothetical protein [DPANN group archaeon]
MVCSRKAISPLIASVFLVVFTIGLSAMLVDWMNTYNRELTQDVQISSKSVMDCIKVNLNIDKIYLNVSNNGNDSIKALIMNNGPSVNIVSAYAYSVDGSRCVLSNPIKTINQGMSQFLINDTGCDIYNNNVSCSDFYFVKLMTDCGATAVFEAPRTPDCVN